MPNHVANNILVAGPDDEIDRFLATCFHILVPEEAGDDEGLQFNFNAAIPMVLTRCADAEVLHGEAWGTKWNAYDTAIVLRGPGYLNFEFNTANNFPRPVYRELGKMFPRLEFYIAAIDPGVWWAMTGHIAGDEAVFNRKADCKTVYERVYKQPFESVLQPGR